MIKELIFDGKKWWQNDTKPLFNATIISPKTHIKCYQDDFGLYQGKYVPTGKVLGVLQSGGIWLFADCRDGVDLAEYNNKTKFNLWFTLKDLQKNGGDIA